MPTYSSNEKAASSPNLNLDHDVEKAEVEQVEDVLSGSKFHDEETRPVGLLDRLQKKNPSPEFLAEVVKMNQTELDSQKVKDVERKIDLLIMPALAICYMVRCPSIS